MLRQRLSPPSFVRPVATRSPQYAFPVERIGDRPRASDRDAARRRKSFCHLLPRSPLLSAAKRATQFECLLAPLLAWIFETCGGEKRRRALRAPRGKVGTATVSGEEQAGSVSRRFEGADAMVSRTLGSTQKTKGMAATREMSANAPDPQTLASLYGDNGPPECSSGDAALGAP